MARGRRLSNPQSVPKGTPNLNKPLWGAIPNPKWVRGTTLVELMMAVAIVGVVGSGSVVMFGYSTKLWLLNKTKIALQFEGRTTLQLIHSSIQQARKSTIVVSRHNSAQLPYSKISFTRVDGASVAYYQQGKSLFRTVGATTVKIAENLRLLQFTFPRTDDMSILGVSVCLEKLIYEGGTRSLYLTVDKARVLN